MANDQTPQGTEQEPITPQPNPEEPQTPKEPAAPATPAEPQEPKPGEPDYKEKFTQSSREAQILAAKNKKLQEELDKINNQTPPTDAEMKEKFPEWETLNTVTQDVLRRQIQLEKKVTNQDRIIAEQLAEQKFQAELRELYQNPEYKDLQGDKDFEEFVLKPKHRGLDIRTIADAYLLRNKKPAPAPERTQGLEPGSGGPRNVPDVGMTLEEADALRQKDPKKYRELLRTGQIKF